MAAKMEILFKVDATKTKETPGTYVFTADDDDADIQTLYIKRKAFDGDPPEKIRIIIKG